MISFVSLQTVGACGPWGLSGAYRSAALISRRLWSAQSCKDAAEGEAAGGKEAEESPGGLCEEARAASSRTSGRSSRSHSLDNVLGGGLLSHTHALPDAYGHGGDKDKDEGVCLDTPTVRGTEAKHANISKGSSAAQGRRQNEITQTEAPASEDLRGRNGRKFGQGDLLSDAGVADGARPGPDTKLEPSKEAQRRPFFFLPSEDEDECYHTEQDLQKDPDLYPYPKTGGQGLSDSYALAATTSHPALSHKSPAAPSSPRTAHKNSATEGSAEIKNRIRYCLQRARSRSSSLSGLGSFEAGLYRLEGLLDGSNKVEETPSVENFLNRYQQSQSYSSLPVTRPRPTENVMPKKFKDAGTITGKAPLDR